MKKRIVLLILLLLALKIPIHATKPTIRVEIAAPEEMRDYIESMKTDLRRHHPEIQMEIWSSGYASLFPVLTANDEKDIPDIAFIDKQSLQDYSDPNCMTDLKPAPYRAISLKWHMARHSWTQAAMFDDRRVIGIPLQSGPGCAYWRRDIFEEVGIDPASIRTMEDLFEAAGKITRDTDGDGRIDRWFIGSATEIARMIIDSSFERYFGCKGEALVESSRFYEAFNWALRFKQAGYIASIEPWSNQWLNAIANGNVAYLIADDKMGEDLRWLSPKTAGKWGVQRYPSLSDDKKPMASMGHGWWLCIPKKSKHKQAAWKVIEYLATDHQAVMAFAQKTGSIPACKEFWGDPYFSEPLDFFAGQQARLLWIEISKEIPDTRTDRFDGIASRVIASELNQVLTEEKPIEKALAQAKRRIYREIRRTLRKRAID